MIVLVAFYILTIPMLVINTEAYSGPSRSCLENCRLLLCLFWPSSTFRRSPFPNDTLCRVGIMAGRSYALVILSAGQPRQQGISANGDTGK